MRLLPVSLPPPTPRGRNLLDRPPEAALRRDLLTLVRERFAGCYRVEREIGSGSAARVFLALDRSGRRVALKILALPVALLTGAALSLLPHRRTS